VTAARQQINPVLYRLAYRRIKVDPGASGCFSPDLIRFYSEPVRVGMPSLIYLRDTATIL